MLANVFSDMHKDLLDRIHDFFWYKTIKVLELKYMEFNSKFLEVKKVSNLPKTTSLGSSTSRARKQVPSSARSISFHLHAPSERMSCLLLLCVCLYVCFGVGKMTE